MQIPQSQILTTRYLNRVFDNTVATYKYYWFLGILDLCVKQEKNKDECLGDHDNNGCKCLVSC